MNGAETSLISLTEHFRDRVKRHKFSDPVWCVYNPLDYAWNCHLQYLKRFGCGTKDAVFLGMNPGPWGMAQTGVPFGEIDAVRNWMGIDGSVGKPEPEHPKRPVTGLQCPRSEVSGRRLWGLFKDLYGSAEYFFSHHYVINYCPLAFLLESGANLTPDKIKASERRALETDCDSYLAGSLKLLKPKMVIGVGGFAVKCATRVIEAYGLNIRVGTLLHPSPASPIANREWPDKPKQQLLEMGLR